MTKNKKENGKIIQTVHVRNAHWKDLWDYSLKHLPTDFTDLFTNNSLSCTMKYYTAFLGKLELLGYYLAEESSF